MRSYETKDRAIQEYLATFSKYSILVHIEAQEKGLHFYQTRSHAFVLSNLQLALKNEKTQDELYQKVRLTPREPRIMLKSISQYGSRDLRTFRKFFQTAMSRLQCPLGQE